MTDSCAAFPRPQLLVLCAALIMGDLLIKWRVRWIDEAGAALPLGLAVGAVLQGAGACGVFASWLQFKVALNILRSN